MEINKSVEISLSHHDIEAAVFEYLEKELQKTLKPENVDIHFKAQITEVGSNHFARVEGLATVHVKEPL